ncbi:S10 family peptidase [Amphibiibacter pelophylacis]|uniref:Peptidase S1 n=1 Tax=Amphibiibacter pelophylacis TaxID=1799477 RepID=A0ACC6NZJ4_9BURK
MRPISADRLAPRPLLKTLLPVAMAAFLTACGGGSGTSVVSSTETGASTVTDASTSPATDNTPLAADQPLVDTAVYSGQATGQVTPDQAKEEVAVTHHEMTLNGQKLRYTVTAGHLTTVDNKLSTSRASMFYVAFTKDGEAPGTRPVTFLYNGGPGSAASWLMLGAFSPKRINTDTYPNALPPAPFTLEDNPDTLLDKSDLVYINPVGTGYSAAIAPLTNKEFWNTDADADSIRDFIQRYLSINRRWNSPKYLMGESYGGPRTAVTSWRLQTAGIPLNGVTLVSPILNFTERGNLLGAMPTMAMAAWYYKRNDARFHDLSATDMAQAARDFSTNVLTPFAATGAYPLDGDNTILPLLTQFNLADPAYETKYLDILKQTQAYTGPGFGVDATWSALYTSPLNKAFKDSIDSAVKSGQTTIADATKLYGARYAWAYGPSYFNLTLLADQERSAGLYDARTSLSTKGIAATIPGDSGSNDSSIVAVNGAYTALWRDYIGGDLKYTTNSSFVGINTDVFKAWKYTHTEPDGTVTSDDNKFDARPDLAATMSLNPYMKVMALMGYFDQVTPFHQTELDLASLPVDPALLKNITTHSYESGHMLYVDSKARTAARKDLNALYTPAAAQ